MILYLKKKYNTSRLNDFNVYPPGGNGLFAFGYLRHSNITQNTFRWLGDNAVAFVGRAHLHDATGGHYPQDNLVAGNLAYETGLYDFESSFFFEAVAGHNRVLNNIAFNGPRAAINFDDGAVGVGLDRIVALYYCSSTLHQIH